MRDVSCLGTFDTDLSSAEPFIIEKGSTPDLFYMKDEWQKDGESGKITTKSVISFLKFLVKHDPLKLLNPVYTSKKLREINRIYGGLPDWRDPFSKFFNTNEIAYFEHLTNYEDRPVDLSRKYIYVPLHNQPEMSTSALGGNIAIKHF